MFTPRKIEERQLTVKRLLEDAASNLQARLADERLLEGLTGVEYTIMHLLIKAEMSVEIVQLKYNNRFIRLTRSNGVRSAEYDPLSKYLCFYDFQGESIKRKLMRKHGIKKSFFNFYV